MKYLCIAIIFLAGCASPIVLHPIEKSDIMFVPAGSILADPNSPTAITIEKDGWFLSEMYVEEIMEAKVN